MDEKLKRDIILDNYQNPRNKGLIKEEDGYIRVNTRNESCVDNIDVMVKVENGIFTDIKFDGDACAICTSSASIMTQTLLGKTIKEVKQIIANYERMINEEPYDEDVLEELCVYDTVYKQPSRKKCALLPMESIKKILKEVEK